jgi:hypothetical protein
LDNLDLGAFLDFVERFTVQSLWAIVIPTLLPRTEESGVQYSFTSSPKENKQSDNKQEHETSLKGSKRPGGVVCDVVFILH